ncbi:MAG: CidA/LrgA family protein [Longicatena sp.]
MKIFREVIIIFGLYVLGELLSSSLSLPLPGSLVGMLLLFVLLYTNIIKLEQIASFSNFLLGHFPFFFIPAGVALMSSFYKIEDTWFILLLICLVTTFLTMGLSGKTIQKLLERKAK